MTDTDLIALADALGCAPLWDGDKASCAWCGDGAPGKLCIDQQPVCEDCRTIAYERALRDALAAANVRATVAETLRDDAKRERNDARDALAAALARAEAAECHAEALEAEKRGREQVLESALHRMLAHSCVADAGADMKDAEDHAAERAARAALTGEPQP